jgi:hypothetical protein
MVANESIQDKVNYAHISTGTGKAAVLTATAMMSERMAYTASGMLEYHGIAEIGAADASFVWAIKKLEYSGSNVISIKWGSASGNFMHAWDNRASVTYG